MINSESYIHIAWRMINELWLKWNDLFVFAIIYSFTNWTENHSFKWSLQYLAERTNSSKRSVQNNLKDLLNKWLIEKIETQNNWVKFCEYYVPNFHSIEKISIPMEKFSIGGMEKISTNNTNIDNTNNIQDKKNKKEKKFDEFWSVYPKKKWKSKAKECWMKLKDIDFDLIVQKAKEYSDECKIKNIEDRFIKRPQWRLNEKRRNDEYETWRKKIYNPEKIPEIKYDDLF